jgi:hypothetical protein
MFIIEFGRSFSHTNKVEVDTCSIEVDAQGSGLAASPRPALPNNGATIQSEGSLNGALDVCPLTGTPSHWPT